jgi:hypothetical protein
MARNTACSLPSVVVITTGTPLRQLLAPLQLQKRRTCRASSIPSLKHLRQLQARLPQRVFNHFLHRGGIINDQSSQPTLRYLGPSTLRTMMKTKQSTDLNVL